jgi:hypothetical protein
MDAVTGALDHPELLHVDVHQPARARGTSDEALAW